MVLHMRSQRVSGGAELERELFIPTVAVVGPLGNGSGLHLALDREHHIGCAMASSCGQCSDVM